MKRVIGLTGATGFLGSQVARVLLDEPETEIIALVRAGSREEAARRLIRSWWDWPEIRLEVGRRVKAEAADITLPRLDLDPEIYDRLTRGLTHLVHAAAEIRIHASPQDLFRTNVEGTARVLELAGDCLRKGDFQRLSHVSTAYVAGARQGEIAESDLTDRFGFNSAYELSKYRGECLVHSAAGMVPVTVFRPGMIVGDSRTGEISTFNTLYYPLRLYITGCLRVLPGPASTRVNLIPVDLAAEAIAHLTFEPEARGRTFHLTLPSEDLPTFRGLVSLVRDWARSTLHRSLPRVRFIPLPGLDRLVRRVAPGRMLSTARGNSGKMFELIPYLFERKVFRRENTIRFLPPFEFHWEEVFPRLLSYAVYHGFLHRSERTVHQQILYRLNGKSRPVLLHDLSERRARPLAAAALSGQITRAAAALQAMGIKPGDRVAITGQNTTRYLALDTAIGIAGAVSVPVYMTSPPTEIEYILQQSRPSLFLIGSPVVGARLGEVHSPCPIVWFSREHPPSESGQEMVHYQDFLAAGQSGKGFQPVSIDFSSPATIRYTSGTTGAPRGVIFTHAHLRFMGQCIASLFPWPVRTGKPRYLSFLPVSHVVEGILGIYAPYYLPAPLSIFFLEDLHELAWALRQSRPSVFFSVPRVYEKVWERFAGNSAGRWFLRHRETLSARVIKPLLRRSFLRKAGWDCCRQLIVGSAPVSEELLRAYRSLGIEVYNAYGLTEAPLLTINPVGANRLGTVGKPLPETEIRCSPDGEILVRGPQVSGRYAGESSGRLDDEWWPTGDLGEIDQAGYLVLGGRKKDLFKTAYGKWVNPDRMEKMLKAIPGIAEAIVVGEERPFCVALLWLDQGYAASLENLRAIDRNIISLNSNFSHPEQVKRWAVMSGTLSIEQGELTANLKVKRSLVTGRLQEVIETVYRGERIPEPVLHLGYASQENSR